MRDATARRQPPDDRSGVGISGLVQAAWCIGLLPDPGMDGKPHDGAFTGINGMMAPRGKGVPLEDDVTVPLPPDRVPNRSSRAPD
jgi:hypothetical protein